MARDFFLSNVILEKYGKWPETEILCVVTDPHNFKILSFLLHGYNTLQLKNNAVPAFAFSLHNFKILSMRQL